MVLAQSRQLIRKYILDREGKATKSEVVKYMQNDVSESLKLSRDTTLKVIEDMDNVVITKGERRGQGHRIYIEDKTEFVRLDSILSHIENEAKLLDNTIERIAQLQNIGPNNASITKKQKYLPNSSLTIEDLDIIKEDLGICTSVIRKMLDIMLVETNRLIQSEKESQRFYRRITNLMIMILRQSGSDGLVDPFKIIYRFPFISKENYSYIEEKDRFSIAIIERLITPDVLEGLRSTVEMFKNRIGNWDTKTKK